MIRYLVFNKFKKFIYHIKNNFVSFCYNQFVNPFEKKKSLKSAPFRSYSMVNIHVFLFIYNQIKHPHNM